jgi:cytochrome b561
MWDWLTLPLAIDRPHVLTDAQQWHARLMFVAWGVIAPLAGIIARYFKVLPQQDWPRQLDSQFWWRIHWIGQSLVLVFTMLAVYLLYRQGLDSTTIHSRIGYVVLALVAFQIALGYFRGSKGGPTAPLANGDISGDHYDMSLRRRVFEVLHKSLGYCLLLLSVASIVMGLWHVNAPRWMWICILSWWILLIGLFIVLQRKGFAIDTYQAIWGPDPRHPGNSAPAPGWGMRRMENKATVGRGGD